MWEDKLAFADIIALNIIIRVNWNKSETILKIISSKRYLLVSSGELDQFFKDKSASIWNVNQQAVESSPNKIKV